MDSTHMLQMVVLSWLLRVRTLVLSLGTQDKAKDTASKRVTHLKYSDCEHLFSDPPDGLLFLTDMDRTDKAVLATNGFAADGNIFVKRLRQRLEVGDVERAIGGRTWLTNGLVVPPRACQGHANPCDRKAHTDYALCS